MGIKRYFLTQLYDYEKLQTDSRIKKLTESFSLEKGDIICREGHIHIYIGNDGTDNFGWGKVNRFYPANYKFNIEKIDGECQIKMDKGNTTEYYTRVYRYEGGKREWKYQK